MIVVHCCMFWQSFASDAYPPASPKLFAVGVGQTTCVLLPRCGVLLLAVGACSVVSHANTLLDRSAYYLVLSGMLFAMRALL